MNMLLSVSTWVQIHFPLTPLPLSPASSLLVWPKCYGEKNTSKIQCWNFLSLLEKCNLNFPASLLEEDVKRIVNWSSWICAKETDCFEMVTCWPFHGYKIICLALIRESCGIVCLIMQWWLFKPIFFPKLVLCPLVVFIVHALMSCIKQSHLKIERFKCDTFFQINFKGIQLDCWWEGKGRPWKCLSLKYFSLWGEQPSPKDSKMLVHACPYLMESLTHVCLACFLNPVCIYCRCS